MWRRRGGSPAAALPVGEAVALGALHGPAELLPVSSSGHMTLVPWLAGWRYPGLEPEPRKALAGARAAQGLRGRAARGHGGRAARRTACRGRRGDPWLRPPPGGPRRGLVPA